MIPIVIGNYNKPEMTEKCIHSIQTSDSNYNPVIQVDNGCENPKLFSYSNDHLIFNEPLGFSKAYNEGIRYAKKNYPDFDYIVLMNNDVEVEGNWLEPLVSLATSEEKVAAVAPCFYQEKDEQSIWIPTHVDILGGKQPKENRYMLKYDKMSVNTLQFFCVLLSRRFLDDYGLLDESMENYCSDMDMSLRAGLAGWKRYVCCTSIVKHGLGKTVREFKDEKERIVRDQQAFLIKWTGDYFNRIIQHIPLYHNQPYKAWVGFYYMNETTGEVTNWHTGNIINHKSQIEHGVSAREKYESLQRLSKYD